MNGDSTKWHRGSRFWKLAPHALYLAAVQAFAVIVFRPDHVPEALGMFGGITGTIFVGSAYVNGRERNPEFQRAMGERERSKEQREDDDEEAGP